MGKHMGGIQSHPDLGTKDTKTSIRTWSWLLAYLVSKDVNLTEVCNDALLAEYRRLSNETGPKVRK